MVPRFSAECMACTIAKQVQIMPEEWSDEKRAEYLLGVMKIIQEADFSEGTPVVNGRINILAETYGIPVQDYSEIKRRYNELMMDISPLLRKKIAASDDPLATAMKIARTANYIDFGTQVNVTERELFELIDKSADEELDVHEYVRFIDDMKRAYSLVYLADNCGEIAADMLFIEKIRDVFPKLRITVIVRGKPVLNDATMEDARMIGLDDIVEVIGNGNGIAGTSIEDMDEVSRSRLESADVIISKGQANFETLNGCGMNIYYLFLCKCRRFERRFNMSKFQGVLANDRRLGC